MCSLNRVLHEWFGAVLQAVRNLNPNSSTGLSSRVELICMSTYDLAHHQNRQRMLFDSILVSDRLWSSAAC